MTNTNKKSLHLFKGNKGGSGKSHTTKSVASYFDFIGREYVLYDTDLKNKDVSCLYSDAIDDISFNFQMETTGSGTSNKSPNKILKEKCDVLINLPANVEGKSYNSDKKVDELIGVDYWMQKRNLHNTSILKSFNLDIYHWYVSNGSQQSLDLFDYLCQTYGQNHKIILVKNFGVDHSWSFDSENKSDTDNSYAEVGNTYCAKNNYFEFNLAKMHDEVNDYVKEHLINFYDLAWRDDLLDIMDRSMVIDYLVQIYPGLHKILGGTYPFKKTFDLDNFVDFAQEKFKLYSVEKQKQLSQGKEGNLLEKSEQ